MKFIKYLLYIILISLIGAGFFYGYRFYSQVKEKPMEALYIIPNNAAIIFQSNNYANFLNNWDKAGELADLFKKDKVFNTDLLTVDSLYIKIARLFKDQHQSIKTYFSIHFVGYNKFAGILSFSFSTPLSREAIESALSKNGHLSKRKFESHTIYQFTANNSKQKYNIVFEHSTLCISKYGPIIERIILEEENIKAGKTVAVNKMIKISGNDAPATIFINYRYFYRLMLSLTQKDYVDLLKQLGHFSQFSVLDFNAQDKFMGFSGYSFSTDSSATLLQSFSNYKAPKIQLFDHIPAQTVFLYYQGAEQLNKYLVQRTKNSFNVENQRAIKSYKADLMVDVEDYFYPWIKSELAMGMLKINANTMEPFAIANTYDPKEAMQALGKLESIANEYKEVTADTIYYRSYAINTIPLPYLLPNIFGAIFNPLQHCYYTNVGDYIIFANKPESIKLYIDNILINKTLSLREGFASFKEKLSSEANVMLYANMHDFNNLSKPFLNSKAINYIKASSMNLSELGDVSLQYISNDNGAYTALNISKTKWVETEDKASWQVALDYPLAKGPFVIKNHKTNKKDIIIFDKHKQMYRINHLGEIVWAIPVAELPLGGVSVVDYYKNGKYQFLFNSANYIYMYDINGNRVENYPIAIKPKATAPLTVVDYDHRRNYRILIPQADNIIHNYTIDGQATQGWKNPKMPSLVSNAVQYFRLGSKDFLLLSDTMGNVVFSNRRGEARMEARLAFTNNIKTPFYKLGSKLVTTDLMGRIILISANGHVDKYLLREFSENHYFTLLDVDNDGKKDFLFLDNNVLYAYNQRHDLMWMHDEQALYPDFQSLGNVQIDSCSIIAYDTDKNAFELMNKRGELFPKEEFAAAKNFVIYKVKNRGSRRLVDANNRVVSNYLIK